MNHDHRNDDRQEDGNQTPEPGLDAARREALKKFSRYAAIAPATMLVLGPRLGLASQGNGKCPAGQEKKNNCY